MLHSVKEFRPLTDSEIAFVAGGKEETKLTDNVSVGFDNGLAISITSDSGLVSGTAIIPLNFDLSQMAGSFSVQTESGNYSVNFDFGSTTFGFEYQGEIGGGTFSLEAHVTGSGAYEVAVGFHAEF